jgi:hypothetical protein
MDITWKIAAGVAVGILSAYFSWEAITTARVRYAAYEMQQSIKAEQAQTAERIRQQQAYNAQQQEQARQQTAIQQRQTEQHKLAVMEQKEAQADAWKRFYQPTPECQKNWTVQCANTFIVAKKAFADQQKLK